MTDTPLFHRHGAPYQGQHGKPLAFDAAKGSAHVKFIGKCGRCGGAGGADKWAHTGWTCFDCGGSGDARKVTTEKLYTAEKLAKLDATQTKVRAKKQAALEAKRAAARAEARAHRKVTLAPDLDLLRIYWPLRHVVTIQGDYIRNEGDELVRQTKKPVHEILRSILKRGEASVKQIAALGSLAESHTKRLQEAKRREASHYVGKVGERVELTITVTKVIQYSGANFYGQPETRSIYCFTDTNGNSLKTFGRCELGEGESGSIRATVKEHSIYKDEKQTILTRLKVQA